MTKSGFDIDEIERLLAGEETSGPWWNEGCEIFYLNDSGQRCTLIYNEGGHGEHDAALIVTLHNSAPAMIAELRELRAEVDRWHTAYDIAHEQATENGAQLAELRAENARLAADLRRCFGGETHAVRNERVMQKIQDHTAKALARAALGEPQ